MAAHHRLEESMDLTVLLKLLHTLSIWNSSIFWSLDMKHQITLVSSLLLSAYCIKSMAAVSWLFERILLPCRPWCQKCCPTLVICCLWIWESAITESLYEWKSLTVLYYKGCWQCWAGTCFIGQVLVSKSQTRTRSEFLNWSRYGNQVLFS
jgi:hypothetical protein